MFLFNEYSIFVNIIILDIYDNYDIDSVRFEW